MVIVTVLLNGNHWCPLLSSMDEMIEFVLPFNKVIHFSGPVCLVFLVMRNQGCHKGLSLWEGFVPCSCYSSMHKCVLQRLDAFSELNSTAGHLVSSPWPVVSGSVDVSAPLGSDSYRCFHGRLGGTHSDSIGSESRRHQERVLGSLQLAAITDFLLKARLGI